MPIEVGIWRLGEDMERISMSSMEKESLLEEMLTRDISILSPKLMLIGTQIPTAYGKFMDLMAMDAEGNLNVVELKRNRTSREVVAQVLDYASWVQGLSYDDIAEIYATKNAGTEFEKGFEDAFGSNPPEKLNQSHQLIIVASELDPSTERIIDYLSDNYGVPVNAVFFRHFRDGDREYLARTWLIDPCEVEIKTSKSAGERGREPWNGRDFYVGIGEDHRRNWDDCRHYGFVCGGGGRWYSQTLESLFPGARVFVNIPKTGYVGVGTVVEPAVPVKQFTVIVDGKTLPILEAPLRAPNMDDKADDPKRCEYLVRVEWIKAVPREEAYWEKGLFAIQHTACRLRNRFTLERLREHFGLED